MNGNSLTSNIWTNQLTNDILVITGDLGLTTISLVLLSGAATFLGNLQAGSIAPTAIDMVIGLPITITSKSGSPISGLTITASAGVVAIAGQP